MDMLNYTPHLAGLLTLLTAASYLAKNEGIRGAGRILGGFALVLVGVVFATHVTVPAWVTWAMMASGGLTVTAGARKFLRRHLPQ